MDINKIRKAIPAQRVGITDDADEETNADQLRLDDLYHSAHQITVYRPDPNRWINGRERKTDS